MSTKRSVDLSDDDSSDDQEIESYESDISSDGSGNVELESEDSTSADEAGSEMESGEENAEACDDGQSQGIERNMGSSGNPGWADAMRKILQMSKPKHKKTLVLSRAKKLTDIKMVKKPKLDFEIVPKNEDTSGVSEMSEDESKLEELEDKKDVFRKAAAMKEMHVRGRVKPNVLDKDREKTLAKIATKGVVQLFNAVRQQQKCVEKALQKAGRSSSYREKVLDTLDKKEVLEKITKSAKSIPVDTDVKPNIVVNRNNEDTTWRVLRDDFMMGNKLKDWDKQENAVVTIEEPDM